MNTEPNTMNIESLQIKRVTGNWDANKSYKPAKGEYVLIEKGVADTPRYLILGNGDNSLYEIMTDIDLANDNIIPFYGDVAEYVANTFIANASDDTPSSVTNNSPSAGESTDFARSDHTHDITYDVLKRVIAAYEDSSSSTSSSLQKFVRGRKMRISATDPTESPESDVINASVGAITIVVDSLS